MQLGASRRLAVAVAAALAFSAVTLSMPSSEGSTTQHGTALTGSVTRVGGAVSQDTVWEAGEYSASSEVQVPAGATLTLRPGVQFRTSAPTAFSVAGTLRIEGSASLPSQLSTSATSGLLLETLGEGSRVDLDHVYAADFPLLISGDAPAAFSLTNSRFWAAPSLFGVAVDLRAGAVLKGNEFVGTAPLRLLTGGPKQTIVEDNRWVGAGDWFSDLILQGRGVMSFTGNAFAPGPSRALIAEPPWSSGPIPPSVANAEGNYWGAITPSGIADRITDADDSPIMAVHIDFDPFLTEAPLAATFVPLTPTNITAVRGSAAATVSWSPPISDGGAPVSGYTVTAHPGGQQVTVAGSTLQATLAGLTDGVSYTFSVAASNSRGESLSAPSNAVTPLSAPSAPTVVRAVGGANRATVSWAAVPWATSYRVVASPGGRAKTVAAPATQAVVGHLYGGTAYRFTVVASNAAGSSAPSAASAAVTPIGPPDRVRRLRALVQRTRSGAVTVRLSWGAAAPVGSPITAYRVATNHGFRMKTLSASRRSIVLKRLKAGEYILRVWAVNAVGDSLYRASVRVQVPRAR